MTHSLVCRTCRQPFTVEAEPDNAFSAALLRMTLHCPPCAERLVAQHEAEDKARRVRELEARWAKICPEEYRGTNLSDSRIPRAFSDAAKGWSVTSRKGLWLIADSGQGKTRCCFAALHRAFMAGLWTHALSHVRFRKVCLAAVSADGEERSEAKRRLEMLVKVDVLFLDDLGKSPEKNETADSELVELIETRTAARRPILWTSQMGGAALEARFGPDRGPALVRRLCEFNEVYDPKGKRNGV